MFVPIAKLAVRQTVALVVARQSRDFIVDHTDVNPESIPLQVGTMCIGEVVATKVKPYTDNAIDKTAAWIDSKRNKQTATTE